MALVCWPAGSRFLMAGTETGRVRIYKLPLTGEHAEVKVGRGAITQLTLGLDDAYLYAACTDGSVTVLDMPPNTVSLAARK